MVGLPPELKVIAGDGRTEKVALSFVHSLGRIDVPVSAVSTIEPREFSPFSKRALPSPHVEVSVRFDIRAKLLSLTRRIVGEALQIMIEGRTISAPIIREPFGNRDSFNISTPDFEDAQTLAAELRARCGISTLRPV
jgi:hypothetical protein